MSDQQRLYAVPCSVTRAKAVVDAWHRHHGSSTSALLAAAVATDDGVVRGVALIGRPVARLLDDGWTLEVTRVATDGTPNACSALYGIARRLAAALGYARLVTYTREDEPGSSPRAAGLTDDGPIRARSWDMPGRPRTDKTEVVRRRRWTLTTGETRPLTWPQPPELTTLSLFDSDALAPPPPSGGPAPRETAGRDRPRGSTPRATPTTETGTDGCEARTGNGCQASGPLSV